MNVKPLKNHLLVKMMENEESTKSGIILAGNSKDESNMAQIIETPDYLDSDYDMLLKGDKVLINPHVGTKVKIEGDEYIFITQEDILAIFNN